MSTASGNSYGIRLGSNSGTVQSSTAFGNTNVGIIANGNADTIQSSKALGNGTDGIRVDGDAATLNANRADGNGYQGGAAPDFAGLGILVGSFTTPPVGKNIARGNDYPFECDPTFLC